MTCRDAIATPRIPVNWRDDTLLVPHDSPLRNPPAHLDPVTKTGMDAVRVALDMTHLSFQRLDATLQALSPTAGTADAPPPAMVTLALLDA